MGRHWNVAYSNLIKRQLYADDGERKHVSDANYPLLTRFYDWFWARIGISWPINSSHYVASMGHHPGRSDFAVILQITINDTLIVIVSLCVAYKAPQCKSKTSHIASMMTSSDGTIFGVSDPLCGNSPVTGEFPSQRPVMRSFDVFCDLHLNKWLNK